MKKNKQIVFLVFGPQGSGKSTQAKYLADDLKVPFFDAGNELRVFATKDDPESLEVHQMMLEGKFVPNRILKKLFVQFMETHDCGQGMVADGFPRNIVQVEVLVHLVEQHNWDVVGIFIDISDETAKERLSKRVILKNGKKAIRQDDQPHIVEKRLALFKKETLPVVEYLDKRHALLRVDGEPSVEDVRAEVEDKVRKYINGR
jgi:adenylate kinase